MDLSVIRVQSYGSFKHHLERVEGTGEKRKEIAHAAKLCAES